MVKHDRQFTKYSYFLANYRDSHLGLFVALFGSLQADAVQLAGELGAAEPEVSATTEHESQAPVLRQDLVRDLY